VFLPELNERQLQVVNFIGQVANLVAQPHACVDRHLIVARAAGVQLGAGWGAVGERRLDVHVHVLELRAPFKLSLLNFALDDLQALLDVVQFFFL